MKEDEVARITSENDLNFPLVVDLDGTLIRTDLLFESANHSLKNHPLTLFRMIIALLKGKSVLKTTLAEQFQPQFSELPINDELVEWLTTEKKQGRNLILATASDQKLASIAAQHFGFFDEVLATNGDVNLKSTKKRDLLVEKFGEKGFDYIGNSNADKPIWTAARYSYVVSRSQTLLTWLEHHTELKKVFDHKQENRLKVFFRALRPHQWAKNLLVFFPLLTANLYTDMQSVWVSLQAFFIFSITASSVYLLNDLVDIEDDRRHPRKRYRPFASGQLSILVGWLSWPLLLLFAFRLSALTLPLAFMATLGIYYCSTVGYSFYFKRQPIIDVLVLAGLYVLRVTAGTVALNIAFSFWLLSFSMCFFLSLAFMKRVSEFKSILLNKDVSEQKLNGRGYQKEDFDLISSMGIASGFLSVVFLALYIQSEKVEKYYLSPELLWLLCPLLLFWIARAWLITHKGDMHDDPVLFALKDKKSWITMGLLALVFCAARYLP